jgi:hypothetical protein
MDPNQAIYLDLLSVIRERIAFVQGSISEFREQLDDALCNESRCCNRCVLASNYREQVCAVGSGCHCERALSNLASENIPVSAELSSLAKIAGSARRKRIGANCKGYEAARRGASAEP